MLWLMKYEKWSLPFRCKNAKGYRSGWLDIRSMEVIQDAQPHIGPNVHLKNIVLLKAGVISGLVFPPLGKGG